MQSRLRIFILTLILLAGAKTYAGDTDTMSVTFSKNSTVLTDVQKLKFRDVLIYKDSIISMTVIGWPDEKIKKCKSRRLAKKRAKAVSAYLSEQGITENKITISRIDTSKGIHAASCRYGEVIIVFQYHLPTKVQSEH